MKNLHNGAVEERLQIIENIAAFKAQRSNWIDKNGNLKKSTRSTEVGYLIGFVIFFNFIIIPKTLFLLGIDTFLRNLYKVDSADLFTLLALFIYFNIVQFRMLWGHRQGLLLLQNTTHSTEFLYVLNDGLSAFTKTKWKTAVLMIIMIILMFFSQINGLPPKLSNYLGILSPIIIILIFGLSFQQFQRMRQNIQQFEELILIDNNIQLSNVKPEI